MHALSLADARPKNPNSKLLSHQAVPKQFSNDLNQQDLLLQPDLTDQRTKQQDLMSLQNLSLEQQLSQVNYNLTKSKLGNFVESAAEFDIYNPAALHSFDPSDVLPDTAPTSDYESSGHADFLNGVSKQMDDPKQGRLSHHMHVSGAMMSEAANIEQLSTRNSTPSHRLQMSNGLTNTSTVATDPERRSSSFSSMFPGHQFFPNHHPFDFNSYPMTNPPIYDSTMAIPYNEKFPRRRRLSISNGQIGQIINHEAFFYDEQSNHMEDYRGSVGHLNHFNEARNTQPQFQEPFQPQQMDPHLHSSHPHFNAQIPSYLGERSARSNAPAMVNTRGAETFVAAQPPHSKPFLARDDDPSSKREPISPISAPDTAKQIKVEPSDHLFAAGVPPPNHLLIYNNEVIYNPNDGPIPGTAAWKKQRLLERNRIAALKCRQRKKQVQMQMQQNVSMFEQEVEEKDRLLQKYAKLMNLYNMCLREYFANGNADSELLELKELVNLESIDQYDVEVDG